jgi:hypothetical protein
MSNFPNGFANGLSVRGMPLLSAYPGAVFWVDSVNGSNNNKGTFDQPWSTIDYAVGMCTASRGDIIVAKAGHVETVTASGGLALDVAGVCLIGLGCGALRPTVNFTTVTSASCTISAASCAVINVLFTGGIDALTSPITISAADVSLINTEYRDVTGQATDVIVTTAGATRLVIDGHRHLGDSAAGGASAIALVGTSFATVRNFMINGNFSVGAIDFRTTASTNVSIHDGYIWTKNSADIAVIDTVTASTGRIGPNLYAMLTDNAANITEAFTGATFHYFDNIYICNLAGEKAMLTNITASTDA